MKYEALLTGKRVEIVEAETQEAALLAVQNKCEGREAPVYIKEKETGKPIWGLQRFFNGKHLG